MLLLKPHDQPVGRGRKKTQGGFDQKKNFFWVFYAEATWECFSRRKKNFFREANSHLFGEDSDFSDSDSENGEIEETQENFENEETDEVTDNEAIKSTLQFEQISNYVIPFSTWPRKKSITKTKNWNITTHSS